jgi:hypothetical protein
MVWVMYRKKRKSFANLRLLVRSQAILFRKF